VTLRLEIFISQKAQRGENTMLHADEEYTRTYLLDVDLRSFYGMRDREITSPHFEATYIQIRTQVVVYQAHFGFT
jgi:hypothetical protein